MTDDELLKVYESAFNDNTWAECHQAGLRAVFEAGARAMWIPVGERLPDFTVGGGDLGVLIYSPSLENDESYPGHSMQVSNPEYVAKGNAAKHGFTHWMPLPAAPLAKVE